MNHTKIRNLWGSRFDIAPHQAAIAFASGRDVRGVIPSDNYLIPYDIWLNQAHAIMLYKQQIITHEDIKTILTGLLEIKSLVDNGTFKLDPEKEDVHTNIESWLIEKYGIESAGKLHTARSRNDQILTDTRLYLRDQTLFFIRVINDLVQILNEKSQDYKEHVMPGFTHHQHAMVTTLGHVFAAFSNMFLRDVKKLQAIYAILNRNPLGSAASFGTSFKIDRHLTTQLLGFTQPDANSLDAITNRWEPEADLCYCLSSFMTHLSIFAETLILFSMPQFSFVTISDSYSTGSSLMPQKRNPDMLEVMKGKAAFVHGALSSLLSSGKGAFIGYNRDSQWTKYTIMDVIDTCKEAPQVAYGILDELRVHKDAMETWANRSYIGATSLLELLCQNYNIAFRKGKMIIERAIKYSKNDDMIDRDAFNKSIKEEDIDIHINEDTLHEWQNPQYIFNLYASYGSPSVTSIDETSRIMKDHSGEISTWLKNEVNKLDSAKKIMDKEIKKILKVNT